MSGPRKLKSATDYLTYVNEFTHDLADLFLDEWIHKGTLDPMLRAHIKAIAMKQHRHRHERGRPEDKRKGHNSSGDLSSHKSVSSEYLACKL